MRRFLFLAGATLLVLMMLGIASGAAIAKTGPFLPGSLFFPVQNISEQTQARLQSPVERQTEAYLLLTERRIENIIAQTGTIHEAESLAYLSAALDQAVLSWSQLPVDTAASLRDQVLFLLKASEIAMNQLTVAPTQNPGQVAAFLAKISTLQSLAEASEADPTLLASLAGVSISSLPEDVSEQANLPDTTIEPLAVPFPAGSVASEHAFFPLTGQHAQIGCEACHADGVYEGTVTYCEACHGGIKPDPHYAGDCAACHSAFSWSDISFDHSLVVASACVSCHLVDNPADHYGNQCGDCHSTTTWGGASFNHQAAGATDCKSCHSDNKPANHFSGQCSACHSTNSWQGASFHHNGQTDCKSCHSSDKPNNHYSGQCSACHSTNNWDAEFSHSGQTNCKSCHAGDRPGDHDNGQCSECHNTSDWDDADDDGDDSDDGDEGGDDDDDGDDGDNDNGEEDDGDDDEDDEDEEDNDENGSWDSAPITVAVGFHAFQDCATCHQPGETNFETFQSGISSWWQKILNVFQNMVPFSVG